MQSYDQIIIDGQPLTDQEKFVLEQIEAGRIADLKDKFGEKEEDRQVRARFLEELLTDNLEGIKVHRRGIGISHAIIAGGLDLENAEILHYCTITDSKFQSEVNFRDSYLRKHLNLRGSIFERDADFHRIKVGVNLFCGNTVFKGSMNFARADIAGQFSAVGAKFESEEQEVNFNSMKVGQDAFFDNAAFKGPVNFGSADIARQFSADGAKFESQGQEVNFNAMKVGQSAFIQKAVFQGPMDFGNTDIGGQFNAKGAKFENPDKEVNFNAMKVGQDAFFDNAIFQGPVNFGNTHIGRQFNAKGAKFESREQEVNFNGMKMGQSAFFDNAVFQGPVDFGSANIGGQFSADGAKFESQEQEVNFNAMKVGQSAFFRNAVFQGPVNFVNTHIGRQFNANGAKFESPDKEVNFNSMKVGQDVFIRDAVFQGPVDFVGVDIGGQFSADGAKFEGAEQEVNFDGIKVGQITFFRNTVFQGKVSLNDAHFLDLLIEGNRINELGLERTKIERELRIENIEIDRLKARNMHVNGPATLDSVTIKSEGDLRDCSFQQLSLLDVTWPVEKDTIWLDGLSYLAISTSKGEDEPKNWRKLLEWINLSRFNTQNYSQLEAYFQRCGHKERADEVFIEGKRRELWGRKSGLRQWATRFFWDFLAGYGRKPAQTFRLILPLILLGTIIFAPEFEPKFINAHIYLKEINSWLIKFILSLDRFLPGVDLGLAKHWQPSHVCLFTWIYWYILKISGWITVPIALAAIYTRIK